MSCLLWTWAATWRMSHCHPRAYLKLHFMFSLNTNSIQDLMGNSLCPAHTLTRLHRSELQVDWGFNSQTQHTFLRGQQVQVLWMVEQFWMNEHGSVMCGTSSTAEIAAGDILMLETLTIWVLLKLSIRTILNEVLLQLVWERSLMWKKEQRAR